MTWKIDGAPTRGFGVVGSEAKNGCGEIGLVGRGHEDGLDILGALALVGSAPTGHRIPARGETPGLPTGMRRVLKERRIDQGYPLAGPGCGVPSERIRFIDHPTRVAPWAGMRRPVGAEPTPIQARWAPRGQKGKAQILA